jgi:hypothetical protein
MKSLFSLAALSLAFAAPIENTAESKSNYIVILKKQAGIQSSFTSFHNSILRGIEPFHHYDVGELRGFAAALTASQVDALNKESQVRMSLNPQYHLLTI